MGHKFDALSLVWTSHVSHVKSLCLLVYFSLSSYSWSFEVCFASFRIYTCLFPVLTSGIKARFNDRVRFSGSIIDDWTRLERCVHLGGVVLAVTFLTVMKILLEKLFQRDSLCWDINFVKEIMERRSKLLKIKWRRWTNLFCQKFRPRGRFVVFYLSWFLTINRFFF